MVKQTKREKERCRESEKWKGRVAVDLMAVFQSELKIKGHGEAGREMERGVSLSAK